LRDRSTKNAKRITLKDIAEEVGVSINTVSRALKNKPDIRVETARKIQDIAVRMGYTSHLSDKRNKGKWIKTVGLVITDNTNPFFSNVIKGIEDVLSQSGYNLILSNTDEIYVKEKKIIDMLIERRVDGILITPSQVKKDDFLELSKAGIPCVLVGRHFEDLELDFVICDDKEGAFTAVDHLIRLGHKDILFINAPKYISSAIERQAGFEEAFEKNDLELNPSHQRTCEPKLGNAYNMMRSLLIEGISFTAVFTFSDLMMLGVIKALNEEKIRIPADISVVGFDDIEFVSLLNPPLTTIHQDSYRLGVESARLLLSKIHGDEEIHQIVLPTQLIVRGSTKKANFS